MLIKWFIGASQAADRCWQSFHNVCPRAKSLQSCLTLSDPLDCSPPGSSLSIGFSRQEYWSGMPCPPPGDLPSPGTGPHLLCLLHRQGRFFTTRATWEAHNAYIHQNTVLYMSNIYKFEQVYLKAVGEIHKENMVKH